MVRPLKFYTTRVYFHADLAGKEAGGVIFISNSFFIRLSSPLDAVDNRVPGSHGRRADGQPDRGVRCGPTRPDAHVPEPVRRQPRRVRHHAMPGVHAVHAGVDPATPMDNGLGLLQARAAAAGHQHHGFGGHHHGDRDRPVLGDRPRFRAERTARRVRVHSHGLAAGRGHHFARRLLPGNPATPPPS